MRSHLPGISFRVSYGEGEIQFFSDGQKQLHLDTVPLQIYVSKERKVITFPWIVYLSSWLDLGDICCRVNFDKSGNVFDIFLNRHISNDRVENICSVMIGTITDVNYAQREPR